MSLMIALMTGVMSSKVWSTVTVAVQLDGKSHTLPVMTTLGTSPAATPVDVAMLAAAHLKVSSGPAQVASLL